MYTYMYIVMASSINGFKTHSNAQNRIESMIIIVCMLCALLIGICMCVCIHMCTHMIVHMDVRTFFLHCYNLNTINIKCGLDSVRTGSHGSGCMADPQEIWLATEQSTVIPQQWLQRLLISTDCAVQLTMGRV